MNDHGTDIERPYISVVATARNDDHGGNLLDRMHAFVNGWIGQSKRHGLSSELIIVDWNAPEDRPTLRNALRLVEDTGPCTVRFIEVPREVHARYRYAEALPLYQMIGKNVGIRRSRGRFVLATNVDILFSDELMSYMARGRLENGRMYRLDRYDVMSGVPIDGATAEQLEYCRGHLIRVSTREGTFDLAPDGTRHLSAKDIAEKGSGIRLGSGWYAAEYDGDRVYRWVTNDAEITVDLPHGSATPLMLDVAPGPGVRYQAFILQIVDSGGAVLGQTRVSGRSVVSLHFPSSGERTPSFRFHVVGGGERSGLDPRILNFQVYRCAWADPHVSSESASADDQRNEYILHSVPQPTDLADAIKGHAAVRRLHTWITGVGARKSGAPPVYLHINGCGDFTLMAREHWFDLRGYPEFDTFSFNLDALLCYMAHHARVREEILADPMRIYHIEHGLGSGWTPEGQAKLFERLRANGIPWITYEDILCWNAEMHKLGAPLQFNPENWGLADLDLREESRSA